MSDYLSLYEYCELCPRKCGVNRRNKELGYCESGTEVRAAFACLHKGEEPPISGEKGSGTVFFSGCTLQCASCQNCQISQNGLGGTISPKLLTEIFLELQKYGAANINLVTATHWIPGIVIALQTARNRGLSIPVVWNTSGFETEEMIDLLNNFVDIYLVDIKTLSFKVSELYLQYPEYPEVIKITLSCMIKEKQLKFNNDELKSGVVVRHLVLPGLIDESEECLRWLKKEYDNKIIFSVMSQYLPVFKDSGKREDSLGRMISSEEYKKIQRIIDDLEIQDGFFQEFSHDNEWIPDFTKENPFPGEYARPVWHYRYGFITQH